MARITPWPELPRPTLAPFVTKKQKLRPLALTGRGHAHAQFITFSNLKRFRRNSSSGRTAFILGTEVNKNMYLLNPAPDNGSTSWCGCTGKFDPFWLPQIMSNQRISPPCFRERVVGDSPEWESTSLTFGPSIGQS